VEAGEANVEALVEDLRREAEELRRRLGPSPSDAPSTAVRVSAYADRDAATATEARIDRLRALADPRGGPLRSHREAVGGLVLAVKRLLIRLLTPIWEQQTQFDRAAVDAIADLREAQGRLAHEHDDLDRRLRRIEDALARGTLPASFDPAFDPAFDYGRFEARFRDPERTREKQRRYLAYFPAPDAGPVLDLGCGDGTFLRLLRECSVAGFGVERGKVAVERARAAGLDVREGDLLDALAACADASLGGVVAFQVVEHLTLPAVVRLVRLARRKLRPGGCLILETVNLASLIVHARAWTIDPTHRLPLHPLTLRFLVDDAGFRDSELVYSGPVEPERRLETSGTDPLGARNVEILNEVLFGPQDCAVVARG